LFNILGGIPVITQINPVSAHQGDTITTFNVTGLYTHFTSGFVCAFCGNADYNVTNHLANNDTSLTLSLSISQTAALGLTDFTVQDTTDGLLTYKKALNVAAGIPALISAAPNTMGQGITQTVTLTG